MNRRVFFALSLIVAVLVCTTVAIAQTMPVSDPQALTLAAQSLVAMTGGRPIVDVTLTGNATRIAGSSIETGTAMLAAKGTTESRADLSLSGSNRSEIRNGIGPLARGAWIGPDGLSNAFPLHNAWTDACWFFPGLSSMTASDPTIVLSYIGLETSANSSLHHLRSFRYLPAKNARTTTLMQKLSMTDFYLDATSLLPVAIRFNIHPDGDAGLDIPVEVYFLNYQHFDGVQVPLRVQKYLQGGLVLDLTITSVSLNSGLSDASFSIQ